MRQVVRIGAYVPRGVSEGVRVAGIDEDAFTLGATAAERAWRGRQESPGPLPVHLFGEFPPVADWGFSALLGRAGEVVRHPASDSLEFSRALRSLEAEAGEGPALLVAADLPERTAERGTPRPSSVGAAGVAVLLEGAERSTAFALPKATSTRSAVSLTLHLGEHGKDEPRTATLVGDWDVTSSSGPEVDRKLTRRTAEREPSAVSEGAYVPRPRYLENLPSRWRFLAETCGACHGTTFPARGVCRRCGRRDALSPLELPLDGGRVVAVTTIGKGGQPTEFDAQVESFGPYDVALVELARGMRVTLQATDVAPGELQVGDHVNTLLRRLYPMEGEWRYGRKAVPLPRAAVPPVKT